MLIFILLNLVEYRLILANSAASARYQVMFRAISQDKAVFNWVSKNQNQSNYSDQTQETKTVNQSEFEEITRNQRYARENARGTRDWL